MRGLMIAGVWLGLLGGAGFAQTSPEGVPATQPTAPDPSAASSSAVSAGQAVPDLPLAGDRPAAAAVATKERLTVRSYDLEVHLRPADGGMSVLARMVLRNDGAEPLKEIALEVSGGLHWESVSAVTGGRTAKLPMRQTVVDTDADHTGAAAEAVLTLTEALGPKQEVEISAIYSGVEGRSAARLERIGVPEADATAADWDEVAPGETFLRGFGNALWYPVAAQPVVLGGGAALLRATGEQRARNAGARMHVRLVVEYVGEAPSLAFLCGQMEPLRALGENQDAPVGEAPGVATAELRMGELGFRLPTVFVVNEPAVASRDGLMSVVTTDASASPRFAGAAAKVAPVLRDWLGATPRQPVFAIDHPGQAFEDGALLVMPMGAPAKADAGTAELDYTLAEALAHAWFRARAVWLDEGVAHLMQLLWIEHNDGREAALEQMDGETHALALAEASVDGGQALAGSESEGPRSEVFYRTKAAAVLEMLRGVVGDAVMRRVLTGFAAAQPNSAETAAFERALETESGKDLRWFFEDWVLHDRGLPELRIVTVAVRPVVGAVGAKMDGSLVVVEVRNDGGAAAEVPVTVRSGGLTATERLRIAGHSVASTRVVFQDRPVEVQVNDGSVPEMIESTHVRRIYPGDSGPVTAP